MFGRLFGKRPQQAIDFELVNSIIEKLISEESLQGQVSVKVKGIVDDVTAYWYQIPLSTKHDPKELKWLQKNGFENEYQLMNYLFEQTNTLPIDDKQYQQEDLQFDILHLTFYDTAKESDNLRFGNADVNFYVLYSCLEGSNQLNHFNVFYKRIMGSTYFSGLHQATLIPNINQPNDEIKKDVLNFEKALVAISQQLNLPINKTLKEKHPQNLLLESPSVQDFEKIIELTNYNAFKDNIKEKAEFLHKNFNRDWNQVFEEIHGYEGHNPYYFPARETIIDEDNIWNSDWKFDAEDVEWFISDVLNEEWTFDYPEETYAHDLFPYIQKKLEEKGLELMNMDTECDSYIFFLARKENVSEILDLSNQMSLGIEKIHDTFTYEDDYNDYDEEI